MISTGMGGLPSPVKSWCAKFTRVRELQNWGIPRLDEKRSGGLSVNSCDTPSKKNRQDKTRQAAQDSHHI